MNILIYFNLCILFFTRFNFSVAQSSVTISNAEQQFLCDFIHGTNIGSLSKYSMWECVNGTISTNPCGVNPWYGLRCSNNSISSVNISSATTMTGK